LKTAVLVNEFGEIGIDNELIVTTGEDMVELNGCICCTINNDLVEVYKVLERQEQVIWWWRQPALLIPASGSNVLGT